MKMADKTGTMISREEYLKRYLSGDGAEKKKTKKKRLDGKKSQSRFKIIEDDIDLPVIAQTSEATEKIDEFESDEDEIKPVVTLVNNETDELKMLGKFNSDNWQSLEETRNAALTSSSLRRGSPDYSPPRRARGSPDASPRRGSPDASPPRRTRGSPDQSPPRRTRGSPDESPPRRNRGHVDPGSPNFERSPPRRHQRRRSKERDVLPAIVEKAERTESGKKAGLQRAAELRQELVDAKRNEEEKFQQLSEEISGRGASAVQRSKMTLSKTKRPKELTEEQKQRAEEMSKKYAVWNKGQKQVQEREQKLAEMAAEASKPFARHVGDEDLEEHLKGIEYKDDPMLQYMREKKRKETGEVPKPTFNGPWPPNRYNIPPGFRWDGVDRSNGFEVKLMSSANMKKADEEEYYKWTSGRYE